MPKFKSQTKKQQGVNKRKKKDKRRVTNEKALELNALALARPERVSTLVKDKALEVVDLLHASQI